jgi:purine-nucleoside phosphorylase
MQILKETKEFIETKLAGFKPEVAMVVGSGLGGVVSMLSKPLTISYADIPHFPHSTVPGHAGQIVAGEVNGKRLLVLNGRVHY